MWLLLLSWSSLSLATSLLGGRAGQQIHPNRHRHHQHDIYIAGFFPTTPGRPGSAVGQGVMPAVKLALHDVNRSPDILPNHHLRMHWNNTAVRKSALCHGLAWPGSISTLPARPRRWEDSHSYSHSPGSWSRQELLPNRLLVDCCSLSHSHHLSQSEVQPL